MDNELFVGDSASEPTNSVPTAAARNRHNLMINGIPFCISRKTGLPSLGFVAKNEKNREARFSFILRVIPVRI